MADVANTAPKPTGTFQNAATVLAFISAAAIGIERTLEGGWSVVDLVSSQWPDFGVVSNKLNSVNQALGKSIKEINTSLTALAPKAGLTQADIDKVISQLPNLQSFLSQLRGSSATNPNLQNLLTGAQNALSEIQTIAPDVKDAANAAPAVLADLSTFLATFNENPIRRLMSLFLGVLAGLALARIFSLDVIDAALGMSTPKWSNTGFLPHLVVAFTGLVIGLGSSPTHEVIKAIQSYKLSQES
jgi:ABC-type transporter Mla subunit MlaD